MALFLLLIITRVCKFVSREQELQSVRLRIDVFVERVINYRVVALLDLCEILVFQEEGRQLDHLFCFSSNYLLS